MTDKVAESRVEWQDGPLEAFGCSLMRAGRYVQCLPPRPAPLPRMALGDTINTAHARVALPDP
jgi:hypothetical protein